MTYTQREKKTFCAMVDDFESINCDHMIKERGLEWDDFRYMGIGVKALREDKEVYTKSERIAKYFESFGMIVTSYVTEWRVQL